MNLTTMLVAALILVPAIALAAWAWFAIGRVDEELRVLGRFEGGPPKSDARATQRTQRTQHTEGPRWPTPG